MTKKQAALWVAYFFARPATPYEHGLVVGLVNSVVLRQCGKGLSFKSLLYLVGVIQWTMLSSMLDPLLTNLHATQK